MISACGYRVGGMKRSSPFTTSSVPSSTMGRLHPEPFFVRQNARDGSHLLVPAIFTLTCERRDILKRYSLPIEQTAKRTRR